MIQAGRSCPDPGAMGLIPLLSKWSEHPPTAPSQSSRVPRWLDPTGRKDQGGEEIGYRRFISAKIFETSCLTAFGRSGSEDLWTPQFCSGRAADFFEAGGLGGPSGKLKSPPFQGIGITVLCCPTCCHVTAYLRVCRPPELIPTLQNHCA